MTSSAGTPPPRTITKPSLARPGGVSVTADSHETRDVVEVRIVQSADRPVTLLYDPEHNLEERILNEQFLS